jgi:hypothetical protein
MPLDSGEDGFVKTRLARQALPVACQLRGLGAYLIAIDARFVARHNRARIHSFGVSFALEVSA